MIYSKYSSQCLVLSPKMAAETKTFKCTSTVKRLMVIIGPLVGSPGAYFHIQLSPLMCKPPARTTRPTLEKPVSICSETALNQHKAHSNPHIFSQPILTQGKQRKQWSPSILSYSLRRNDYELGQKSAHSRSTASAEPLQARASQASSDSAIVTTEGRSLI